MVGYIVYTNTRSRDICYDEAGWAQASKGKQAR